jgi:hypothetical protein
VPPSSSSGPRRHLLPYSAPGLCRRPNCLSPPPATGGANAALPSVRCPRPTSLNPLPSVGDPHPHAGEPFTSNTNTWRPAPPKH